MGAAFVFCGLLILVEDLHALVGHVGIQLGNQLHGSVHAQHGNTQVNGVRVELDSESFSDMDTVYADGLPYPVIRSGDNRR